MQRRELSQERWRRRGYIPSHPNPPPRPLTTCLLRPGVVSPPVSSSDPTLPSRNSNPIPPLIYSPGSNAHKICRPSSSPTMSRATNKNNATRVGALPSDRTILEPKGSIIHPPGLSTSIRRNDVGAPTYLRIGTYNQCICIYLSTLPAITT